MLLIPCPWCGPRNDAEFLAGGEAHVTRPDPTVSDGEWGEYLHYRANLKGRQAERWFHALGCRRWFNVVRDTVTHEIARTYPIGSPPTAEGE
jgi:heterotetrameric sarcosine oxidase delta subunit